MEGSCKCNNVRYIVSYIPKEIANCYCTICQTLHQQPFVRFAKYNINEVQITEKQNLMLVKSSERAQRAFCKNCNTLLFMYYNNSSFVWMVVETFNFDTRSIEHYNIYTDTAIVDII